MLEPENATSRINGGGIVAHEPLEFFQAEVWSFAVSKPGLFLASWFPQKSTPRLKVQL